MWHDTSPMGDMLQSGRGIIEPGESTESPATKRRIKNLLDVAGVTEQLALVKPRPATEEELAAVHDRSYIAAIKEMSAWASLSAKHRSVRAASTSRRWPQAA